MCGNRLPIESADTKCTRCFFLHIHPSKRPAKYSSPHRVHISTGFLHSPQQLKLILYLITTRKHWFSSFKQMKWLMSRKWNIQIMIKMIMMHRKSYTQWPVNCALHTFSFMLWNWRWNKKYNRIQSKLHEAMKCG